MAVSVPELNNETNFLTVRSESHRGLSINRSRLAVPERPDQVRPSEAEIIYKCFIISLPAIDFINTDVAPRRREVPFLISHICCLSYGRYLWRVWEEVGLFTQPLFQRKYCLFNKVLL